jgi:hypothetical protein
MSVIAAFVLCAVFLAIEDIVPSMTRAFIPSVFVAATLFLIGFRTFLPETVDAIEWRTAVTALAGILGMMALLLTVGQGLVGWQTVVAGTPTLTGGIVATLIMNQAASEAGLASLAVLAIVMYVMQGFVGYPLASLALKKEGLRLRAIYREGGEDLDKLLAGMPPPTMEAHKGRFQFIPPTPEKFQTTFVSLTKLGIAAWASVEFSKLTGGAANQFVVCLVFGVIAAETGFLERRPHLKNQSFGYLILSLMTYVMVQLSKSTARDAQRNCRRPGGHHSCRCDRTCCGLDARREIIGILETHVLRAVFDGPLRIPAELHSD